MRKPRDLSTSLKSSFDLELKALNDKARALKERKVVQLGKLVVTCGADALTAEELAGALLAAIDGDAAAKEGWRKRGAALFQRSARTAAKRAGRDASSASPNDIGTPSA